MEYVNIDTQLSSVPLDDLLESIQESDWFNLGPTASEAITLGRQVSFFRIGHFGGSSLKFQQVEASLNSNATKWRHTKQGSLMTVVIRPIAWRFLRMEFAMNSPPDDRCRIDFSFSIGGAFILSLQDVAHTATLSAVLATARREMIRGGLISSQCKLKLDLLDNPHMGLRISKFMPDDVLAQIMVYLQSLPKQKPKANPKAKPKAAPKIDKHNGQAKDKPKATPKIKAKNPIPMIKARNPISNYAVKKAK